MPNRKAVGAVKNLSTQRHGDTEKSKKPLFFVFVFPLCLCVFVLRGFGFLHKTLREVQRRDLNLKTSCFAFVFYVFCACGKK